MHFRSIVSGWLVVGVAVFAACGDRSSDPSNDSSGDGRPQARGGDEPVTAQALAFVAAEHAGEPSSAAASSDLDELGKGTVGVELRYRTTGEYDGDVLGVGVVPGADPSWTDCASAENDDLDGCLRTQDGVLMWEDETFESDPGVVYVAVTKGEATVLVFHAGPVITEGVEDPRELGLPIIEDMFAIANDARVDITTSADAVASGAKLTFWQEP